MNVPKIGMRNIKTAISVFLCLLFFEVINRKDPVFACVAAIICMQPTVDNSWDKGMQRIIGTIIGGLLSILFIIIDNNLIDAAYIFLIPFGIILLIEICVVINKKDAVIISCVVYLSIMLTQRYEGDYLVYTYNRVIDTSIGILIALLVNRYFTVPKFINQFINRNKHKHYELNDSNNEEIINEVINNQKIIDAKISDSPKNIDENNDYDEIIEQNK